MTKASYLLIVLPTQLSGPNRPIEHSPLKIRRKRVQESPQESGSPTSRLTGRSKALGDILHHLRRTTVFKIPLDIVRFFSDTI